MQHDNEQPETVKPQRAGASDLGDVTTNLPIEAKPDDEAIEEARAEHEATDVGELAGDRDDERLLLRYLRQRGRLADEVRRIESHAAQLVHGLEQRIRALDYVYGPAAREIAAERLRGKRTRTYKTAFGNCSFRHINARIFVRDPAALLAAAESNLEYLALTYQPPVEPRQSAIAEHFKKSGEIPPGCDVVPPYDKFNIS